MGFELEKFDTFIILLNNLYQNENFINFLNEIKKE